MVAKEEIQSKTVGNKTADVKRITSTDAAVERRGRKKKQGITKMKCRSRNPEINLNHRKPNFVEQYSTNDKNPSRTQVGR